MNVRKYQTKDGRTLYDPDDKNEWRAEAANVALSAFAKHGYSPGAEDDETMLGDLLGDIIHLCDREGFDFENLIERARMHYQAETSEGG